MQRWLSILLAVVLGWFSPANAQAHTRASQADYDAGPAVEKVVVVVGITGDSYEGDQSDPLSLHKYLYCGANPINHIDPTGHDGEGGVTGELGVTLIQTIVAVGTLSVLSGAAYYVFHDPTDNLMQNIPLADIQAELNQEGPIIQKLSLIVDSSGKNTLADAGLQTGGRLDITVDETAPGQNIRNIWENKRNHAGYSSAQEEMSALGVSWEETGGDWNIVAHIDQMSETSRLTVVEALQVREQAYFTWLRKYDK